MAGDDDIPVRRRRWGSHSVEASAAAVVALLASLVPAIRLEALGTDQPTLATLGTLVVVSILVAALTAWSTEIALRAPTLGPHRAAVGAQVVALSVLAVTWLQIGENTLAKLLAMLVGLFPLVFVLVRSSLAYRLRDANGIEASAARRDLLPTQQACLDQIEEAIRTSGKGDNLVQLVGRWGDGKSALLTEVRALHPDSTALVDVWKHQSPGDMHVTLVSSILATPAHLRYWGWMHLPASMMLGRVVPRLRGLTKTRIPSGTEVEVNFELPELPWQQALERSIRRVHARTPGAGASTIVVLDELDRAESSMTQKTLTIMRRSLDLDGIVTVLSYVESVITFKAFNLRNEQLSDLHATALASANAYLNDRHATRLRTSDEVVEEVLTLDPREVSHLERRLSEKYLSTRPVVLREPSVDDVIHMLEIFPSLSGMIGSQLSAPECDQLKTILRESLGDWVDGHSAHPLAPLRNLEAAIFRRLSAAVLVLPVTVELVAACVLTAVDWATLTQNAVQADDGGAW